VTAPETRFSHPFRDRPTGAVAVVAGVLRAAASTGPEAFVERRVRPDAIPSIHHHGALNAC